MRSVRTAPERNTGSFVESRGRTYIPQLVHIQIFVVSVEKRSAS